MAYITADRSPNRHPTGVARINHQSRVALGTLYGVKIRAELARGHGPGFAHRAIVRAGGWGGRSIRGGLPRLGVAVR